MKVALIGATGLVGTQVLKELVARGHEVVAVARNTSKIPTDSGLVTAVSANALDAEEVTATVAGNDVVVSTYNPGWTNPNIYAEFLQGAQAIQEGAKRAGVSRYIIVGGAGSLEVAPGVKLIDTPQFPQEFKAGASAASEYLDILRKENELDWTFVSPAIEMHAGTSGTRRGTYRVGHDNPVFDENQRSIISAEDLAVAIVDEIENPQFIKKRFTAAY